MKSNIESLIEQIISFCESCVQQGDDGLDYFVDPNDGVEISAHYGATHAAASFIIWGKETGNTVLYDKGVSLLLSILKRWNNNKLLPSFHFDFNNLALCMVEDLVNEEMKELIRKTICNTVDSNHDTINWLPMRWVVNKKRLEWFFDKKFQSAINHCKETIAKATNADGGVEDRLPRGLSFNLQYDLATVAVLQYLNVHGESLDLSKELGFLLNAVAPDGDINYQGRGTNQIFAWGLWIYLLASCGQEDALKLALQYLSPRLSKMLENNNMILNEWDGKEKYLWWDYHYASVYAAHCMLWLILSYVDFGKKKFLPSYPTTTETGLHIHRSDNFFVSWFEGRSEYLAEKGPTIAAIWSKKQGVIFKGTFGPWQGYFGNRHIVDNPVILNSWSLYLNRKEFDWTKIPYIHRTFEKKTAESFLSIYPFFLPISVREEDRLVITWDTRGVKRNFILSLANFCDNPEIDCYVNRNKEPLLFAMKIKNQYGWVNIFQTRYINAECISLIIK